LPIRFCNCDWLSFASISRVQIRADCGDVDALGAAFQATIIAFGRVDICVNNAALPETGGDFHVTCRAS
jgi:NAD(P)-dependent dehydrogenase (short-subunit alcohol dehydrogenase family)